MQLVFDVFVKHKTTGRSVTNISRLNTSPVLEELFEQAIGRPIKVHDYDLKFEDLDIPSLKMIVLLIQIENRLQIEIGEDQVSAIRQGTLNDFIAMIQSFK